MLIIDAQHWLLEYTSAQWNKCGLLSDNVFNVFSHFKANVFFYGIFTVFFATCYWYLREIFCYQLWFRSSGLFGQGFERGYLIKRQVSS